MSKARQLAELGNAYSDGALSNRNLLINSDFQIDQRGYSGTTGTDGTKYTVDRWNNYFASTITKSKTIIDGQNRGILTINSASGLGDIGQRIENSDLVSGQTMTLSFWAKSNSGSTSAKFQIGNNIDAGLVNQSFTLTTSWQKFEFSFAVPTFSNLAGTAYSYVSFQSNIAGIDWSLSQVQLEVGDTATPFEHRSYGQELALCQRYFEKDFFQSVAPAAGLPLPDRKVGVAFATNNFGVDVQFAVTKRAAPTVVFYRGDNSGSSSSGSVNRYNGSIWVEHTVSGAGRFTDRYHSRDFLASGLTVGNSYILQYSYTADAEL